MNARNSREVFQETARIEVESLVLDATGLLTGLGLTLSVAESCSGGLLSKMMTDIAGSSAYFLAGVVAYSNSAKTALIGIPAALIDTYGAVSAEVAEAMAEGIRRKTASDLALSITGIAGPSGGTETKPVGTVYVGLAAGEHCRARLLNLSGSRGEIRSLSAYMALEWLCSHLIRMRKLVAAGGA